MIYGIDTHALIWFLENNPKLGKKAGDVLEDPENSFFIPTIVLCEMKYLMQAGRLGEMTPKILSSIKNDSRFEITPLDLKVVDCLPAGLDIHDGIIIATALMISKEKKDRIALLTKDKMIRDSGLVDIIWD